MKPSENPIAPWPALPVFPQDAPLAWAAVCGAVSAIGLRWNWAVLGRLLAVVVLVELVFRSVAWLVSQVDSRGDGAESALPPTAVPYARPDSPAQHAAGWAARALRSWRRFWGTGGRALALLLAAGLLLCDGIGAPAMWVGLTGLAAAAVSGIWLRRSRGAAVVWSSLLFVTFAWVVGALVVGGGWSAGMAAALGFGLASSGLAALWEGRAWGRGLACAGLAAPAVVLIAERLALPAAAILFVAAPAFALAASGKPREGLLRAVWPLLLISMAIVALSLGW